MGIDEGDIDRLARESGLSPTILRRRLSQNAASANDPDRRLARRDRDYQPAGVNILAIAKNASIFEATPDNA
jgi:hypothetical protein